MKLYNRLVNKFWRTIHLPKFTIKISNSNFKIYRFQNNNLSKSSYLGEQWMQNLLLRINKTKNINTFIDVGVNIGQTLLKIKAVNPNVRYVGFEPNPYCCAVTEQIIANNKLSNCTLIPCGLNDKNKLLKLILSDENNLLDSAASIIDGFRKDETESYQFVNVFKLDDIIDDIQMDSIDLIKIDIEGAELEAIQGMKNTLHKYAPILIMEVLPSYDIKNEFRINRQQELSNILKESDYSIFQLVNKERNLSFKKVDKFPIHSIVGNSDYISLPKHIDINNFFE